MSSKNRSINHSNSKGKKDFINQTFYTTAVTSRKKSNNMIYQKKQRSLNNSVLDYDRRINQSMVISKSKDKKNPQLNPQQKNPSRKSSNAFINTSLNEQKIKQAQKIQIQKQKPIIQNYMTPRTKSNICKVDDQNYQKTKSKVFNANFSHHDPQLCVCADCNCGRHLCKLHVVKPDLTKNSIYTKDYYNKKPVYPLAVIPSEGGKKLEGPHMDMNSTYGKDFIPKKFQIDRPHPKDELTVGGPAMNLTSYSSGFPGHRGDNQYVKPTFNTHLNGILSFHGDSSYKNTHNGKEGPAADLAKWGSNWKPGQPWLGNTTYNQKFRAPSKQYIPKHVKIVQKLQIDPDFDHQYQTTYRNDFLDKGNRVCPAKIKIESKRKGIYNNLKGNFNENSDFKGMSPDFHAISTSKHSFV